MTMTAKPISQADLGTSNTTLYTTPASTTSHVATLIASNKTSNSRTVTVQIVRSGGSPVLNLATTREVPPLGTIELVSAAPIVLATGDLIRALASATSSIDMIGSLLEQV